MVKQKLFENENERKMFTKEVVDKITKYRTFIIGNTIDLKYMVKPEYLKEFKDDLISSTGTTKIHDNYLFNNTYCIKTSASYSDCIPYIFLEYDTDLIWVSYLSNSKSEFEFISSKYNESTYSLKEILEDILVKRVSMYNSEFIVEKYFRKEESIGGIKLELKTYYTPWMSYHANRDFYNGLEVHPSMKDEEMEEYKDFTGMWTKRSFEEDSVYDKLAIDKVKKMIYLHYLTMYSISHYSNHTEIIFEYIQEYKNKSKLDINSPEFFKEMISHIVDRYVKYRVFRINNDEMEETSVNDLFKNYLKYYMYLKVIYALHLFEYKSVYNKNLDNMTNARRMELNLIIDIAKKESFNIWQEEYDDEAKEELNSLPYTTVLYVCKENSIEWSNLSLEINDNFDKMMLIRNIDACDITKKLQESLSKMAKEEDKIIYN